MKRFIWHIVLLFMISCAPEKQEGEIAIKELSIRVDKFEVSTGEFAEYIVQKNGQTTADSLGWSAVFNLENNQWQPFPQANWSRPDGKNEAELNIPVTQVSYFDACAFCAWKKGRLPTAKEWDLIAGKEVLPGNVWQGVFPVKDLAQDGFDRKAAPIGSFKPNDRGVHDLFGNVWEWTSTIEDGQMIIKGGSYLCDKSFCSGYFPDKYQKTPKDSGLNHLGFRCVYDE